MRCGNRLYSVDKLWKTLRLWFTGFEFGFIAEMSQYRFVLSLEPGLPQFPSEVVQVEGGLALQLQFPEFILRYLLVGVFVRVGKGGWRIEVGVEIVGCIFLGDFLG